MANTFRRLITVHLRGAVVRVDLRPPIEVVVWEVGNRIADGEEAARRRVFEGGEAIPKGKVKAEVLYAESDGVWLHLQREKRRSVEVRVATLYTGKQPLGKKRSRLADKCSIAALGLSSEAWQEHVLKTAHRYYDLEQTRLLIVGGDGNQCGFVNRKVIHLTIEN